MLTILEGSTFCISDERGDLAGDTGGLFAQDTRRLSRFVLTINGQRPLLLSSGKVEYFSAAFYLRNPVAELAQDALSIARTRFVGDSMQERIVISNESLETLRFEVGQAQVGSVGDALGYHRAPPAGAATCRPTGRSVTVTLAAIRAIALTLSRSDLGRV